MTLVRTIWRRPANRHKQVYAVGRFFNWQISKRIWKRPTTIAFHGARLCCYPDSTSTSASLYFGGYADYWVMKFIAAYLRPGDRFLDIGGNSGVYSVMAAAYVGNTGAVDAFEPVDRNAQRIEEQARLNGYHNVRVHRVAAGSLDSVSAFGFAANDAMMHLRRPGEKAADGFQVRTVRLDDFQPYEHYAMGKMDIEGAEPLALRGASQRLRDCNPPVWLLEIAGHSNHYRVSSSELIDDLADAGYDCAIFNVEKDSIEYTREPRVHGAQNALFVATRQRRMIEDRLLHSSGGAA